MRFRRFLRNELDDLKNNDLYRILYTIRKPQGMRAEVNGKNLIIFASNNYLGLTHHPKVINASIEALNKYGTGTGGSRLVTGNFSLHEKLEEEITNFKGTQSSIVFPTGYMANIGVLSSIMQKGDIIVSDSLNHASIIDGCRLSRADVAVYKHRDMADLERILKGCENYKKRLIVTDGIFSMNGTMAPLPEIIKTAEEYNAGVMVDDAHATGILGKSGRGTAEYFGLEDVDIQMGTLSKALAGIGGYIAGDYDLVDFLINTSRTFIFSTSIPPAAAAASIAAIDVMENEPDIIKRLWKNIKLMRGGISDIGFDFLGSRAQIIPILIGDSKKTMEFSKMLQEGGIFAPGIRPPSVPPGRGRIRITITAMHTESEIMGALDVLEKVGKTQNVV